MKNIVCGKTCVSALVKRVCVCLLAVALCGIQESGMAYADTKADGMYIQSVQHNRAENLDKAQCTRRALILGETSTPQVPLLDVTSMEKMMKQCTFSGKKMSNVVRYNDHTKSAIKKKIESVFANTKSGDISYIYFTCHGDEDGNIIIGSDDKYFSPKELRNFLDEKVQGKVVLMIDSCFSGASIQKKNVSDNDFNTNFLTQFTKDITKSGELASSKYRVLCSSSNKEFSDGGKASLATKYWKLGAGWNELKSEATSLKADKNGDKKVTLDELYKYSYKKVLSKNSEQHVQVYPKSSNTVLFGKY